MRHFTFVKLSDAELKALDKRAEENLGGFATDMFVCENCKIVDMHDGTILIVPSKKGEQRLLTQQNKGAILKM